MRQTFLVYKLQFSRVIRRLHPRWDNPNAANLIRKPKTVQAFFFNKSQLLEFLEYWNCQTWGYFLSWDDIHHNKSQNKQEVSDEVWVHGLNA